jgi:hypothetical protein
MSGDRKSAVSAESTFERPRESIGERPQLGRTEPDDSRLRSNHCRHSMMGLFGNTNERHN